MKSFIYFLLGSTFILAGEQKPKYSLKEFQDLITKIYSDRSGFLIPQEESKKLADDGACSTYGEILPESIDSVFSVMSDDWLKKAAFVDLGSGVGKAVIQGAFRFKKSIGIELSKTRVTHAKEALKDLIKENSSYENLDIEFKEANILNDDFSFHGLPAFVFMCSTCFNTVDSSFTEKLVEKLEGSENIKVLTSLTKLPLKTTKFKYIGAKKLAMTWSTDSVAYFYVRSDMPNEAMGKLSQCLDMAL